MFKVQSDKNRNLLTVSYWGCVGPEEVRQGTDKAVELLGDLQSGFTLLTDLTGLEEMDPASAPELARAMQCFTKQGIKKVIRVVPDPSKDIGLKILSLFHYPRDLQMIMCESLAEAMKVLED